MAIATELTRRLGLAAPVLSAPMAGVSGGRLASAVSNAGGLGFIGAGYGEREDLERELKAAGNVSVGVGFINWVLAKDPDLLHIALDHEPRALFLSFGDISPFAAPIKAAGVPLIVQVQTVADAVAAAELGADMVVAQGTEAGGHAAQRATLPLVPAVVDAISPVPVVAAGGIADGRGLAAALMLGAQAAVCGTAFYAAEESLAHSNAKAALMGASGDMTVRSDVFDRARGIEWPAPWSLRTLRNRYFERWRHEPQTIDEAARAEHQHAAAVGDVETAAVVIGEAVDLVHAIEPAAMIINRMIEQAERLLQGAPALTTAVE